MQSVTAIVAIEPIPAHLACQASAQLRVRDMTMNTSAAGLSERINPLVYGGDELAWIVQSVRIARVCGDGNL